MICPAIDEITTNLELSENRSWNAWKRARGPTVLTSSMALKASMEARAADPKPVAIPTLSVKYIVSDHAIRFGLPALAMTMSTFPVWSLIICAAALLSSSEAEVI